MYIGYRKAVLSGVAAAAILGAGGTALAVSTSDTTDGKAASGPSVVADQQSGTNQGKDKGKHAGKHKGKHADRRAARLDRLAHAQIVAKDKDGKFVTRYVIHGSVTSVSSTSITVQSADKTSKTFAVTSKTKVRERAEKAKATKSSIAKVAKGDEVVVGGTGTSKLTAVHVVELAK